MAGGSLEKWQERGRGGGDCDKKEGGVRSRIRSLIDETTISIGIFMRIQEPLGTLDGKYRGKKWSS